MFDEYPRPQMERADWINLCGPWDYAITQTAQTPLQWDGQIQVPFSPESPASVVSRVLKPDDFLWYHRNIDIPWIGDRVLLHFGAVDQQAVVWCNGQEVGSHIGGYTPFTIDITEALDKSRRGELIVCVRDQTEQSGLTRGKQKLHPGGIWYSAQSGIWQPVWIEMVPSEYIKNLRVTPDYDNASVTIEVIPKGTVEFRGKTYESPACISIPDFVPWTPETPHLYGFTASLGYDTVKGYFAMRKFSVEDSKLYLNNQPYFHNGILDQGYNPTGLYTYPSDQAMINDIQLAKDMGFNTLRKHSKIEPLRWYYHCDRIGMLVWQDMPNGGTAYNSVLTTLPVLTCGSHIRDNNYKALGRRDAAVRNLFVSELHEMIDTLYNCPCIAMWVIFNEGWGQFDAAQALEYVQSLDSTRTVDHASGWFDQKVGQVHSKHVYFRKFHYQPDEKGRAVLLSEFGGYNLSVSGHSWNDKEFGYNSCISPKDLEVKLRQLYNREIAPAKHAGLAAAIYTQLTDIEEELNGLITYDRKILKIPPETVREIVSI